MDRYLDVYTIKKLQFCIKQAGTVSEAARQINKTEKVKVTRSGIRKFLSLHNALLETSKGGGHHHKRFIKKLLPIAGGEIDAPDSRRLKLKGKRFVFTAAQNNTYTNDKFFQSLLTFCRHNKAELKIAKFAYNQSGFQNNTKEAEGLWYDPKLEPYWLCQSAVVCEGLLFCGELDVLPTAVDPLSGLASYCGIASGIVPHTKVALQSLPRLKNEAPRFLYTTGAITLRNYIQRKAGQKAEFHHVYGALYVEIDKDGEWFARQLIADSTGEFYDLNTKFTPCSVTEGQSVAAINFGDIHVEKEDKAVSNCSWGASGSLLSTLRPEYVFIHDLTDFSSRNHHSIGNPYHLAAHTKVTVQEELKKSAEFLARLSRKSKVIVVESNHHEALERWLREANSKTDPANAEFYHESNARIYKAIRLGESFDVYEWALRQEKELTNVQFLKTDESFVIAGGSKSSGVECGIHGHRGINGARGASKAFRAIGKRVNVGHSHSAGIIDGVYTAGVSATLEMGYNKGPSSWSHSHIITYSNGKRCIVSIKNGKWRA